MSDLLGSLKILLLIAIFTTFVAILFYCTLVVREYYIATKIRQHHKEIENAKKDSIDELNKKQDDITELNKVQDEISQFKKLRDEITRLNKLQDKVTYLKNPLNKFSQPIDITILDGKISIDESELFYSIKVNEMDIRDILIDKFSKMLNMDFKEPSKLIIRDVKVRLYEKTKDCLNDCIKSILLFENDKLSFSLDCLNGIDGNKYYRLGHFYAGDDLEAKFFELEGKYILLTLGINSFSKFIYDE